MTIEKTHKYMHGIAEETIVINFHLYVLRIQHTKKGLGLPKAFSLLIASPYS